MIDIVPFDQRDGVIWYNGKFVEWKQAKLHVLSHGLHYASSVFEGERAYRGKIFKSSEHSKRLHNSAHLLDFKLPYSWQELDKAKEQLLTKQQIADGYIRAFAWRGSEMMAIAAQNTSINVAIACWQWPSVYEKSKERKIKEGIKLTFARL